MSEDHLPEQLQQFIRSHGGEVSLNFKSVYSMMYSIHGRLERLEEERRGTPDVREAAGGPDVTESQPGDTSKQVEDSEEGVSKSLMKNLVKENQEIKKEVKALQNQLSQVMLSQQGPLVTESDGALSQTQSQQSSLLQDMLCRLERLEAERETAAVRKTEALSSGTEMLSLSTSDTSGQVEDSEEGVSKSLMKNLEKENQEIKEEIYSLKKEVKALQNQLSQVMLSQQGHLVTESDGALSQTQSQQSSLLQDMLCRLERLEAERETAAVREAEPLSSSTEMLSLSTSDTSGQVEDSKEGVFKSLIQDLVKENQEMKKEVKTFKYQLSQCVTLEDMQAALNCERQRIIKELKDKVTGTGQSITSTEINVRLASKDAFTADPCGITDSGRDAGQTHSQVSQSQVRHSTEVVDVPESLEALRNVGKLQEKHESLVTRVGHLEGERDDILDQLNQLKTQLVDALMVDRKKVYEGEPLDMDQVNMSESSGLGEELAMSEVIDSQNRDSFSGLEQQLHLQTADIRNSMQKLAEEVQNMKQELLTIRLEQKRNLYGEMQEKLDIIQSKIDTVMASSSSMLSCRKEQEDQDSPSGQDGAAEPAWLSGMADLSMKISELFQHFENLQSIVNDLMKQGTSGRMIISDKTSELTSDVQGAVLQLQAEFEKLHSTTTQLMKDHTQEQSHIEQMYKTTKELDEEKADKKAVKIVKSIKADMEALDTKVLQCDTKTIMLNRTFQDLLNGHEDHCRKVFEKIFGELDCKLNYTELDSLKKQIEDYQRRIHKQLLVQREDSDHAAGLKKQLTNFNCLSCNRPVSMSTPGPYSLVLPELPSLPSPKGCRRLRTCSNLGQYERSPTEWSMEQTMTVRVSDSSGFNGHVYKTSEVSAPTVSPKEVYCKNKDMDNRSQTPRERKPSRLLPLRPQQPQTQLICIGSSCLLAEKQWCIEDSLPQTLSASSAKKT